MEEDLNIEIYKTSAEYTDDEIIEQMNENDDLRLQLSLCNKFKIIENGKYKSVYMVK